MNNLYNPQSIELPFTRLNSTVFEEMVYSLVKKDPPNIYKGQELDIQLLGHAADKGKDVQIFINQKCNGIIQCKNHSTPFSKDNLLIEIFKVFLYKIQDNDFVFPKNYWIVCTNGLTKDAKYFKEHFKEEIKKLDFESYFNKTLELYKSLNNLNYKKIKSKLSGIKKLNIYEINKVDLTNDLTANPEIMNNYFQCLSICETKIVLDKINEKTDEIISWNESNQQKILEEIQKTKISDEDVKIVFDEIKRLPEEKRIRLLGIDFYGIDQSIINYNDPEFKELYSILIKCRMNLIKKVIKKVNDETGHYLTQEGIKQDNDLFSCCFFDLCNMYITRILFQHIHNILLATYELKEDEIVNDKYCKTVLQEIINEGKQMYEVDFTEIEKKFYEMKSIIESIIASLKDKYITQATIIIHTAETINTDEYLDKTLDTLNNMI